MKKRLIRLALAAGLVSFTAVPALAAPPPIVFCMPDLDGHCRYCELRFSPISMRCVSH